MGKCFPLTHRRGFPRRIFWMRKQTAPRRHWQSSPEAPGFFCALRSVLTDEDEPAVQ